MGGKKEQVNISKEVKHHSWKHESEERCFTEESTKVNSNKTVRGLALWCNGLSHCLQGWHPIWTLDEVQAMPFLV